MKKFVIKTLGCKVNQSESETIAEILRRDGCHEQEGAGPVDICIINTCTVTERASMQSRQAIRQAIRAYPDARILVTGCYAQTQPDEVGKIKGVHDIVLQEDKHRIPLAIMPFAPERTVHADSLWPDIAPGDAPAVDGRRTRAFLKIQDGCNGGCTYCIVPRARGGSRSMPEPLVFENLMNLYRAGYKEVVLSGIHLGCYGLDFSPKTTLFALLEQIERMELTPRIRLSSIEPVEITDEIIDLAMRSSRICRHFHIPLQSGDDHILQKMGRHYSGTFFKELVMKIHERIPDAAIGLDVLVGFPGESDAAFENTCSLIEALPISYLHVFPFSPRAKTPAYGMADKVPTDVIKRRAAHMRGIGAGKKQAFYDAFVGRTLEILLEGPTDRESGLQKGRTSNYIPVFIKNSDGRGNSYAHARIERRLGERGVSGSLISSPDGF